MFGRAALDSIQHFRQLNTHFLTPPVDRRQQLPSRSSSLPARLRSGRPADRRGARTAVGFPVVGGFDALVRGWLDADYTLISISLTLDQVAVDDFTASASAAPRIRLTCLACHISPPPGG